MVFKSLLIRKAHFRCSLARQTGLRKILLRVRENTHGFYKLARSLLQTGRCCGALFDQGCVLLCSLVHMTHCFSNLGYPRTLFGTSQADFSYDGRNTVDAANYLGHRCPRPIGKH